MSKQDTRALSPQAQDELRVRVVEAMRRGGLRKSAAARHFGVSRTSIDKWLAQESAGGTVALRSKPRGRPKQSRLTDKQTAAVTKLVINRCPDQLLLPFSLWTREAVQQLLAERFDIHVSVWTVGRYLKAWGFTPQKPLRRAYEQNPVAVDLWLRCEYPAIRRRAKREKAEIHWGDEMGLRSDHTVGRSYGLRGQTPVIPGTGKRFSCNMISTITNRGALSFMVFTKGFTTEVMIRFLRRLIKQSKGKVFLIMDRHPVHRSKALKQWLARYERKIEMFFLPEYSPHLNPDELLNQDVKTNTVGRQRPATLPEMTALVRSYLRETQCRPHIVANYFKQKDVAYAAAI